MSIKTWTNFVNNPKGELLNTWLANVKNKAKIKNYRLFYIVRSKAEPNLLKFGVSVDGQPESRLNKYVIEYGTYKKNDKCHCTGVDILYLAGNLYNQNVAYFNSKVYKAELALKQYLREKRLIPKNRGGERTTASFAQIMAFLNRRVFEETVVDPKRSTRSDETPYEKYRVGQRIQAYWTANDVKKDGGKADWYPAKVLKVNKSNIYIQFLDVKDGAQRVIADLARIRNTTKKKSR